MCGASQPRRISRLADSRKVITGRRNGSPFIFGRLGRDYAKTSYAFPATEPSEEATVIAVGC